MAGCSPAVTLRPTGEMPSGASADHRPLSIRPVTSRDSSPTLDAGRHNLTLLDMNATDDNGLASRGAFPQESDYPGNDKEESDKICNDEDA